MIIVCFVDKDIYVINGRKKELSLQLKVDLEIGAST